jgi:fumarate hydratase subunit alpha
MRTVNFEEFVKTVEELCISAAYELPEDILAALKAAEQKESNPQAAEVLRQLGENARIARDERIPLCQDTGLAVVFVEQGANVTIEPAEDNTNGTIIDAINAGVTRGYQKGLLRKSVVAEPVEKRTNTDTNTPAITHHTIVAGDKIKITVMTKGGGCENKSQFKMFRPTADKDEIIDWVVSVVAQAGADACPPFIVGVGLGGDFELCCLLSKKALLREIGTNHKEKFYNQLEKDLLQKINALGLGPQGLGGDTTALAVHIETAPCHIASLPAAVNIECHSHRHKSAVI